MQSSQPGKSSSVSGNAPSDTSGIVNACVVITNNLTYRSRDGFTNGDVSALQDFLQIKGYLTTEPSGFFGLLTLQAVKNFQIDNNINPTGFVGYVTRGKIQQLTCK
ncbi:peptidoglycan-binding protein [Patescibacteria group bacterium]|nr:peptidoglycan-binding protein [Patescibacteria group bacterium]